VIPLDDCTEILNDVMLGLNINGDTKSSEGIVFSETCESVTNADAKKLERLYLDRLPVKIQTGGRHDAILGYCGLLHACGFNTTDIEKKLIKFDKERMEIPKNDIEEIRNAVRWVQQKPPGIHRRIKNAVKQEEPIPANLAEKAKEIWKSGKFIDHIKETFQKYWCGDEHIAMWIIIQHVNAHIKNPDVGIHLHITGPSGSGKSDSVKAALKLLPKDKPIIGSFTRRGVIYLMSTLVPGKTILHDDHIADEDEMELNRAILSGWLEGYTYHSVEDGKPKEMHIPPRISRIVTNTESLSHEFSCGQDESRFVQIEIYRHDETARSIIEFIQEPHVEPKEDIEICRAVLKLIADTDAKIVIPKLDIKNVPDPKQIRRVKQEMTVQRCVAIMNGKTEATQSDIDIANMYLGYTLRMLSPELPGLGRNEKYIYDIIYDYFSKSKGTSAIGIPDLQMKTNGKLTSSRFYDALRGDGGTFDNPTGGLLKKVPGLHIRNITESGDYGTRVLSTKELFFTGPIKSYN
jgi:energy-coupling factor transporter ATP-binding protein EcfA2